MNVDLQLVLSMCFPQKNPISEFGRKGRDLMPWFSSKLQGDLASKLRSCAFQTMCCPKCCRGRCCACLGGCCLGVVFSIMVVSSVIMATSYPLLKWLSAHQETIQEVGTCLNATALKANQTLTDKLSAECWDLLCDKCDGDEFLRFQWSFLFRGKNLTYWKKITFASRWERSGFRVVAVFTNPSMAVQRLEVSWWRRR